MERVRSRVFVLSGGLGGLVGFALMELLPLGQGSASGGGVLAVGLYFAGFGLSVGAALGMTEGYVRKNRRLLRHGLLFGLILGTLGGFGGGLIGQWIYSLVPLRYAVHSTADIAVALDSSGSMQELWFWGSDPHGERLEAARHLVDRLSPTDRIAIIDFDEQARVLLPLTFLNSSGNRRAARRVLSEIDSSGGTDLSAGLAAGIGELARQREANRRQYLIFLTDGRGRFDPEIAHRAKQGGVAIFTVGLGSQVNSELLSWLATQTGGQYFPVADAGKLTALFERIFTQSIALNQAGGGNVPQQAATLLTNSKLLRLVRILGWAVMGLALGFGQGVRENTREDLRACALGGLLGGALGGAVFDPIATWMSLGTGMLSRGLADVIVGAAIGGAMRFAQEKMVRETAAPAAALIKGLPQSRTLALRKDRPPAATLN